MKQCRKCLHNKPLDCFYRNKRTCKHNATCKECTLFAARARKYAASEREFRRVFNELMGRQHNACGICKLKFPAFTDSKGIINVDHDHRTGKIRGILCGGCNTMLGMSRDSPDILIAGARYLNRHDAV